MTAFLLRLLTGVRARFDGFDPDAASPKCGRIFFANHTSHLDAAVIWAALPRNLRKITRPVAAADYWSAGVRRWIADHVFRALLVERKKVTRANNPLAAMEAAVLAGDSLIIFPEGTRADCDAAELNEFKPGLFHLARKCSDLEFVPVYLENLNRILPKGDFLLIPLLATAYFGPPLRLGAGEDKCAFLDRAKAAVEALKEQGAHD
ncbi:MAG TPA: lysophospholipid acyltransferase family protein [Tepidisphaeraceae bacterium]|jgi:1-acyl-sn-glycerol-3-phosphate acyltransferase